MFEQSAAECASYVFDTQCEQESYQEYVRDGNDPRNHILYHAAVVLGKAEEFQSDINEYEQVIHEEQKSTQVH